MKFVYFDAYAGLSGDMILGALLDLGISRDRFVPAISKLDLPVEIKLKEVTRASLRALKVDVKVTDKKSPARKRKDVEKIIDKSPFSEEVKKNASKIFKNLFQAEARAHGKEMETTHLHEAGADDAIIDILGACYLLETLEIDKILASPLNVGRGWVKSSHGVLPVPPPAVAEILKGIPVYSAHAEKELVTPTGAAIISTLADEFLSLPELCYEKVGCGAGCHDLPDLPNILRVFYGSADRVQSGSQTFVIETDIDDSNPQILGDFFEKALKKGALDVSLMPVTMKKNRLGSRMTVLTDSENMDGLIKAIFEETTSIGVRTYPVNRKILERRWETITLYGEKVRIKIASFEGKDINIQPEFDDCRLVAHKKNIPVKQILTEAMHEYHKK